MKAPLSWLSEYVALDDLDAAAVAERLTFSGIEVEAVSLVGTDLSGMVVGEVRAVEQHPNADRLKLCQVFDGRGEHRVVCGAPNVAVGQKAAFAPVGASIADGTRLRSARIRGERSDGMLCAEDELGLSDAHDVILLFPPDTPAGTPLSDLLPGADTVLTLEITWNRPDCLSIMGVARELSVLLGRPLHRPDTPLTEQDASVASFADVTVEDTQGCQRYTARVLTDVRDAVSPPWLRYRLERCGVRPISAVVDVTNYVMLECGQPLHAFDLDRLNERRVVVRRAGNGELLRTIDGDERRLDGDMLVIADAREPVAVAGVMGGANSEIRADTRNVLLESAVFDPPRVKLAATGLGMRTESSHRFERGVDPDTADWASRRAAGMMARFTGGRVACGSIDVDNRPKSPRDVWLRFRRAREVIGIDLEPGAMMAMLEALGLITLSSDADACHLRIPSYRPDLEIEADLIEEVARLHGLDALPEPPPSAPVISLLDDTAFQNVSRCRHALLGLGYSEAMHYSFTSRDVLDAFNPQAASRRVCLPNPVSADQSVLRDALLPQLVESLGRNRAHQCSQAALFEIGRVFRYPEGDGGKARECTHLALGHYGPVGRDALDGRRPVTPEESLLWLKGAIEALLAALRVGGELDLLTEQHPAFEPGWSARLRLAGRPVGWIGMGKTALRRRHRIQDPLALAELVPETLFSALKAICAPSELPVYPAVLRDLALVVPTGITHARIVSGIRGAAPSELTRVALFDIFQSRAMSDKRRCLAYSLEYRSATRTLTDDEVNRMHERVMEALRDGLGVEIRDR